MSASGASDNSGLYLVTKNNAPPQDQVSPQNLLERFDLMQIQNEFSQSPLPNTFKSYIDHLPGSFHISKRGRVPEGASIKKIITEGPPLEDDLPIDFEYFSEQTLRDAFTLQEGGFKKKKKKKKKVDPVTGEVKKHKKKRHRESQEGTDANGNGEPPKKKKKKSKLDPQNGGTDPSVTAHG